MNNDIDDDACVRILGDVISNKQVLKAEEMKARNPSIPTWLLTEDFIRSFQDVLRIRRAVFQFRWQKFFDKCYLEILVSHKIYLTFVMFACAMENKCNQNIFESFISVCSFVKFFCDETLQKTEVNFCNLIPDIIMVFYRSVLKKAFCRRGGFRRLVEFISQHRYLTWKLNKYFVSPDDPTAVVITIGNEKLKKELKRELAFGTETNPHDAARDATSRDMAATVLSITSVKLPTLPDFLDLLTSATACEEEKIAKSAEEKGTETAEKLQALKVFLKGYSSSNSESKTHIVKHQDNIEQYENIIQAVIRHNHSKSSSNENSNNETQEKVEGVLEHLKGKIKSLIKVLDENDKE